MTITIAKKIGYWAIGAMLLVALLNGMIDCRRMDSAENAEQQTQEAQ
jgi:hypothetical protein